MLLAPPVALFGCWLALALACFFFLRRREELLSCHRLERRVRLCIVCGRAIVIAGLRCVRSESCVGGLGGACEFGLRKNEQSAREPQATPKLEVLATPRA